MRATKFNGEDQRPIIRCIICNEDKRTYNRACRTCQECGTKIKNRELEVDNFIVDEYLNNVIKANQKIYGGIGIKNHVELALFELEQFKKKSA